LEFVKSRPKVPADLVVTDPVQAGVMTVMAVADTAKFSVARLTRRVF
jgi:energy-converting hydrogenase B subunit Q